mmetsp:Transcript_136784/g.324091  ORF Transcript_136784/g.324091 Transcript_136784/m.324091 type:complete len:220 (-) Transcript_136784:216-875(-)
MRFSLCPLRTADVDNLRLLLGAEGFDVINGQREVVQAIAFVDPFLPFGAEANAHLHHVFSAKLHFKALWQRHAVRTNCLHCIERHADIVPAAGLTLKLELELHSASLEVRSSHEKRELVLHCRVVRAEDDAPEAREVELQLRRSQLALAQRLEELTDEECGAPLVPGPACSLHTVAHVRGVLALQIPELEVGAPLEVEDLHLAVESPLLLREVLAVELP